MSDRIDPNVTIDPAGDGGTVDSLCRRFEAAWQEALLGSARPAVDGFLAQVHDAERPSLRVALARIEEEYKGRMARLCSIEAIGLLGGDDPSEPNVTVDPVSANTAHPAHDQTIDSPPVDPGATIDPSPAADPNLTIDPVPAEPAPVRRRTGPDVTVTGYEILGVLGRGGMGVVYKARHLKLKRIVALKMVLAGAHAGPNDLARFFIEAEAIAQLQHPNIVQVYEIGDQDGLPYFALEFVDGGSLSRRLDGKPQRPKDAARMTELLARSMAYAHLHGIIHRDLKPANVLLAADGQPKITDFGLAKKLEGDSSQTKSGTLMGTPSYMAPEQARGDVKDIGPLADVYSLGVILYEMLTGRTPFVGTSVLDTLRQVQHQEPVAPRRLAPTVPADLDTITLKCLQKDPTKRYASADALADDLRRFLTDQPIQARPVSGAERAWRWCRRNPWVASLTAAVLALLVTVAATSTYMAVRVSAEHATAVAARDEAVDARAVADQNAAAEKVARQEADQQAALALKTLQSLITQVVEVQLGDEPRTQKLKIGLLRTALNGLEQASQRAEGLTGTSIQATMASAYINMGFVFKQLGQTEEAFQHFSRGHEIIRARVQAQPKRDAAKGNLAATFTLLGDMSQELRRDMTTALDYYRKALAIREDLHLHPNGGEGRLDPAAVKQALAGSHTRVAVTILRLGDPAGSLDSFRKALALRLELADAHRWDVADAGLVDDATRQNLARKDEAMQQELAQTYNAVGEVSFLSRDPAAARTYYQKCLEVREALVRAHPDRPGPKAELAAACGNLGDMHLRSGDLEAARAQYTRTLALTRALAESDRQNAVYQRDLGMALYRLGTLARSAGDPAAAATFRECLQIREDLAAKDPNNAHRQVELMRALPSGGQHARAAAIAEKLRAGKPDTEILFEIACGYALCAAAAGDGERPLQGQYAAAAVTALTDAVARGYTDVVALETEPDLRPLHSNGGYQALLAKVRSAAAARSATAPR